MATLCALIMSTAQSGCLRPTISLCTPSKADVSDWVQNHDIHPICSDGRESNPERFDQKNSALTIIPVDTNTKSIHVQSRYMYKVDTNTKSIQIKSRYKFKVGTNSKSIQIQSRNKYKVDTKTGYYLKFHHSFLGRRGGLKLMLALWSRDRADDARLGRIGVRFPCEVKYFT